MSAINSSSSENTSLVPKAKKNSFHKPEMQIKGKWTIRVGNIAVAAAVIAVLGGLCLLAGKLGLPGVIGGQGFNVALLAGAAFIVSSIVYICLRVSDARDKAHLLTEWNKDNGDDKTLKERQKELCESAGENLTVGAHLSQPFEITGRNKKKEMYWWHAVKEKDGGYSFKMTKLPPPKP